MSDSEEIQLAEKELVDEIPKANIGKRGRPRKTKDELQFVVEKAQRIEKRSHAKPFQEKIVYVKGPETGEIDELKKQISQLREFVQSKHAKTKKKITQLEERPIPKILTIEEQLQAKMPLPTIPERTQSVETRPSNAAIKKMPVSEILKMMRK